MDKQLFLGGPRHFCRNRLNRLMSNKTEPNLTQYAIVFSPHPDDETLGCGGTIIKKTRAGADVKAVFMTDGQKSHQHLISENELKSIRNSEAHDASKKLGLEAPIFLGFEDGALSKHHYSAVKRVLHLLDQEQPPEVFIPYGKEPLLWSADHLATNTVVLTALQEYGRKVVVYEYPVWFWYHWPWVSLPLKDPRSFWMVLTSSFSSLWSLRKDFCCSVFVGDVLDLKRDALNAYASQMTRLIPDPTWGTLSDVSNGEFLECFFQEYEFFKKYVLHD